MMQTLSLKSRKYPKLLKEIIYPPDTLYIRGNITSSIFTNCLAVVGSRMMTPYGKKALEHIFENLNRDITIVSGFMYGVDAWAHTLALQNGMKTIAVLAGGVDCIVPAAHKRLYEQILENKGLVISEYDGNIAPLKWSYPKRNRIVAGLCKAVLIAEAALNSGSLITAELSRKFNRKVFTIPGSIFSRYSRGCLYLLNSSGEGVYSAGAINSFYSLPDYMGLNRSKPESIGNNSLCDSVLGTKLVEYLKNTPSSIDELLPVFETSTQELNKAVTLEILSGNIMENGGRYYAY